MSETLIINDAGDPDGAIGVHSTVCQSFESDMVPSCFLYRVEALSGGLDMVALLVVGDLCRCKGCKMTSIELLISRHA